MQKTITKILQLIMAVFITTNCNNAVTPSILNENLINTSHLDNLYKEIIVGKDTVGVIQIYADYPSYEPIHAVGEGIAAVDDAARAGVLYWELYKDTNKKEYLDKVKMLAKFMFSMQRGSGWFYNFIFDDGSINKDGATSEPVPSWWTWRAFWFLSELLNEQNTFSPELYDRITGVAQKSFIAIRNKYIHLSKDYIVRGGLRLPNWMPSGHAYDQSAILILGLVNYYNAFGDTDALTIIKSFSNGLTEAQVHSDSLMSDRAFLSWENLWHAYGNNQSYALLEAYTVTSNQNYLNAALDEINIFYPKLISELYYSSFNVIKTGEIYSINEKKKYPQIAYDIRPMVWACLKANEITGEKIYAERAGLIGSWLYGNNDARIQMYFQKTGICYDGINNASSVNKNSGAESTIESLLLLFRIQKNTTAFNELKNGMNKINR